MKVLCMLLCVAFASGFNIDNNGTYEENIVGGELVRIEDLPYQASLLRFGTENICGATIIHESWVVTAAHCVQGRSHISVKTGSRLTTPTSGTVHTVGRIIIHSDFNNNRHNNNIALIELEEPIELNDKQRPVEVAKSHDIPRVGQVMRISGFGKIGPYLGPNNPLRAVWVTVKNQEDCEEYYRLDHPITDNMFCAGNGTEGVASADSGGPAVMYHKLYGIITSDINPGSRTRPEVYTRVHKYYDWITEKTGLIL